MYPSVTAHSMKLVLAVACVAGMCVSCQEDQPAEKPVCMEKLMMVDELEWETKVKCHHAYEKSCYQTYETTYRAETVSFFSLQ